MFHDRPVIGIGCFFGGAVGTQGSVFVVKIDLGDKPVSDFKDTAVPRGVVRGGGVTNNIMHSGISKGERMKKQPPMKVVRGAGF